MAPNLRVRVVHAGMNGADFSTNSSGRRGFEPGESSAARAQARRHSGESGLATSPSTEGKEGSGCVAVLRSRRTRPRRPRRALRCMSGRTVARRCRRIVVHQPLAALRAAMMRVSMSFPAVVERRVGRRTGFTGHGLLRRRPWRSRVLARGGAADGALVGRRRRAACHGGCAGRRLTRIAADIRAVGVGRRCALFLRRHCPRLDAHDVDGALIDDHECGNRKSETRGHGDNRHGG